MQDTPTTCLFYRVKGEPDLLVGTKKGAIGMVVRQRYWHMFYKGEKGGRQINCLLVVPSQQQNLILTTSEDNLLKIFTNTFQEKVRINMLKQQQNDEMRRMLQK